MLPQTAIQSYRQNSVTTADPLTLILMAYDRAVTGCRQENLELAGRAITELIRGLDMSAGTIAWNLLSIYQYCNTLIREGKYEDSADILQDLRNTWASTRNNPSGS